MTLDQAWKIRGNACCCRVTSVFFRRGRWRVPRSWRSSIRCFVLIRYSSYQEKRLLVYLIFCETIAYPITSGSPGQVKPATTQAVEHNVVLQAREKALPIMVVDPVHLQVQLVRAVLPTRHRRKISEMYADDIAEWMIQRWVTTNFLILSWLLLTFYGYRDG